MGFQRWAWIVLVALVSGGCALLPTAQAPQSGTGGVESSGGSASGGSSTDPLAESSPPGEAPSAAAPEPPAVKALQPDLRSRGMSLYQSALDKGYGAARLTQSARVPSDWVFVASRWQEAIALLDQVPVGHQRHGQARQKIEEYDQNRRYAIARSRRPPTPPPNQPPLALRPSPQSNAPDTALGDGGESAIASNPEGVPGSDEPAAPDAAPDNSASTLLAVAPILNRMGGIPVIGVELNGREFAMAIDTGASLTVLTPAMAAALQLQPTGTVRVNTPSDTAVELPISQVQRLRVGNIIASDLQVAVSPSMTVGLLGQNFFGSYDLTLRGDRVEFHRR
jgi:predicted aspartyl protease